MAQTFVRHTDATLALTVAGGEVIETTAEHPFYVENQGFTPAGELGIGTNIVTRAGPSLRLHATASHRHQSTVYNLEVEDFHTYFVGKAKLWVHNLDCEPLWPAAKKRADDFQHLAEDDRPHVACAIWVEGHSEPFIGASLHPQANPWTIDPEVKKLYDKAYADLIADGKIPPGFHAQCAEVQALSAMYAAGINPAGKEVRSFAVNISDVDPKRHGSARSACASCKHVLTVLLNGTDLAKKINGDPFPG